MKINKTLKAFLLEKEYLVEACSICVDSITFWEKRSNKLFNKMDNAEIYLEGDLLLENDDHGNSVYQGYLKEIEFLMQRMQFENEQLDSLESRLEKLETALSKALSHYAKKQKK